MHFDPAYQWSLLSRWFVHTDWLLRFSVPALSSAGRDLMPGTGGARVVQNSGCWTSLGLVPALLYRSCFLTALCLTSSTRGSYGYLSAILLPIMYRVSRAEDKLPGVPHPATYSEICSGHRLTIPLKHPLRHQNIDMSTQNAFSSVSH